MHDYQKRKSDHVLWRPVGKVNFPLKSSEHDPQSQINAFIRRRFESCSLEVLIKSLDFSLHFLSQATVSLEIRVQSLQLHAAWLCGIQK